MDLTFWFLKVFIIAAVQAKIKKNQRMISINFQNKLGAQIVMIQNIIMMAPNEISNQNGQVCFVSEFAITLKNKVKFSLGCIVISFKKSNIYFVPFYLHLMQKFLQWIIGEIFRFFIFVNFENLWWRH